MRISPFSPPSHCPVRQELETAGCGTLLHRRRNAYLDYLEINTFTSTDGSGTRVVRFSDITDRSDSACRYYVLSTPFTLTSKSGANIYINVSWSTPGVDFIIARTTFVLQATAAKTVPPSADSAEAVILTNPPGPLESMIQPPIAP